MVQINGSLNLVTVSASSDIRLKKNIRPIDSSLDKVEKLRGVSYEWKVEEYPDRGLVKGRQVGLIAQDVESVLPEIVSRDKNGYKLVSYSKLTAVLVEAVKELKAQNEKQDRKIEKQKSQIERLRALVEELKS
jgi:hypothetical protein